MCVVCFGCTLEGLTQYPHVSQSDVNPDHRIRGRITGGPENQTVGLWVHYLSSQCAGGMICFGGLTAFLKSMSLKQHMGTVPVGWCVSALEKACQRERHSEKVGETVDFVEVE